MFSYRATIHAGDTPSEGFAVLFPDVPEAGTDGATVEEALARAPASLETALSLYVDDGRDLPPAVAAGEGEHAVRPSLVATMKLAVYQTMRANGLRKADLARVLAVKPPEVERLLDLTHETRASRLEEALRVLDCKVRIEVDLPARRRNSPILNRMAVRRESKARAAATVGAEGQAEGAV